MQSIASHSLLDPPLDAHTPNSGIVSPLVAMLAVSLAAALLLLPGKGPIALIAASLFLIVIGSLHARLVHAIQVRLLDARRSLMDRNREIRTLIESSKDAILVLNDEMICVEANRAASEMLRVGAGGLPGHSIELFAADKSEMSVQWNGLLACDRSQGRMELARADGERLIAEFTAIPNVRPNRHLLVLRDATRPIRAQAVTYATQCVAKSARREADILRSANRMLAQDLTMDHLLRCLLENFHSAVPYNNAQVLLLETPTRLFSACAVFHATDREQESSCLDTFDTEDFPLLKRVIEQNESLLVGRVQSEIAWREFVEGTATGSWIGVPLQLGDEVVGLLSFARTGTEQFTLEQLRLAGVIAVSTAVAIKNARLEERAEIFRKELECCFQQTTTAHSITEQPTSRKRESGWPFREAFRSAPIAMSLSTFDGGDFLEVSRRFELSLGWKREELLGSKSAELGIWANPADRRLLFERLRRGEAICNAAVTLKTWTGESMPAFLSADRLISEGRDCLFLVLDGSPARGSEYVN
jgi:PAS domain S-box-containing protein